MIKLSNYGIIISSKSTGEEIYNDIKSKLDSNESVTIDFGGIKSMATFCAKQIFGRLYIEMGGRSFFEKIKMVNADNDLKTIIEIGIQHSLANNEEAE